MTTTTTTTMIMMSMTVTMSTTQKITMVMTILYNGRFLYNCIFMMSRSFAKAVGCEMNSLKACVKTKPVQAVLDAQSPVFSNPILLPFGPVVDGYFLPGIRWSSLSLKFKLYNYRF